MVSWFESAMEESEKYIEAMSDCIPEIKEKRKTMSNADKIRSMDDAELADLFSKIDKGWDAICGSYISMKPGVLICGRDDFGKQILKWLQSEAE